MNLVVKDIINKIKNTIGIEILKNGSLPGSLSIYKKVSSFKINHDFRLSKDTVRFVSLIPLEENEEYFNDSLIEIEATDNDKILYRIIDKFVIGKKYYFSNYVEVFSQIRLAVYISNKNDIYERYYEEKMTLIREIHLGMGIGGGHSKLVNSRFIKGKKEEKINIFSYENTISNKDNKDPWIDWERQIESFINGKKKKYLESQYFKKGDEGREKFREWVRLKVQGAKLVTIVDPYFDLRGAYDFYSCINTNPETIIITTNPEEDNKDNPRDKGLTKEKLSRGINELFNNVSLFIAPKDKFHDRYLIIQNNEESKLYNLSNSWNGTVNNYSLFVQEVSKGISLEISDEINDYIHKEEAEKVAKEVKQEIQFKEKKEHFEVENTLYKETDDFKFIENLENLYNNLYYGTSKEDEFDFILIQIRIAKISCDNFKKISIGLIERLLKKQKEEFLKIKIIPDEKHIQYYDTQKKIMDRVNHKLRFERPQRYEFKLDYVLYETIKILFFVKPQIIIDKISRIEKEICFFYKSEEKDDDSKLEYSASEPILCMFWVDLYYEHSSDVSRLIDIAKLVNWQFPKLYLAKRIIEDRKLHSISEIIDEWEKLELSAEQILELFIDLLKEKQQRQEKLEESYCNSIFTIVDKKTDLYGKLYFAYEAIINFHRIDINILRYYVDFLEKGEQYIVATKIENLLLFKSLESNDNLRNKVIQLVDAGYKDLYDPYLNKETKNVSEVQLDKYIDYIYIITSILYNRLKNQEEKFSNIINQLNTHKPLLFNVSYFVESMGLYYYDANFILNTIWYIKKNGDVDKCKKVIDYFRWYLPLCFDSYSNDYYNISINVIDVFSSIINDEEKADFAKKISNQEIKAVLLSSLNEIHKEQLEYIEKYFSENILPKNQTKSHLILLQVFINLSIHNKNNEPDLRKRISELLYSLVEKYGKSFSESFQNMFDASLQYFNDGSTENKANLTKSIKTNYLPYTALNFVEEIDE